MKGTILDFNPDTNQGIISAENKRFTFNLTEFKSSNGLRPGLHVDFVAHLGNATQIYALNEAPNAVTLANDGVPETSTWAILSLVFGILGLLIFGSLLGVIFGHVARSKIQHSNGKLKGKTMAMWGLCLGYLGIILSVIFILIVAVDANNRY
ncbi:DUF4190 domain-containing protein [Aliiglaciecola lipolytica]|uniref:DUF4190 domain-containing protein n=1 Tax=Aliiglaciecola lipolytica E3 TaxID=1127673 RepID=K6YBJ3_9ALTE|nr:DUF4190 domain-containing protein [Aliiglaciecola lipolytica]GAC15567.1 hypothetical protein GLIP_2946 [Aliiglaciecola lipolytica E3]